jgi:hypothetical protein
VREKKRHRKVKCAPFEHEDSDGAMFGTLVQNTWLLTTKTLWKNLSLSGLEAKANEVVK